MIRDRLIEGGHWDLKELLTLSLLVYRRWEHLGLKAFLHHHILDYMEKLTRTPKIIYLRKLQLHYIYARDQILHEVRKWTLAALRNLEDDLNMIRKSIKTPILAEEIIPMLITYAREIRDYIESTNAVKRLLKQLRVIIE